MGGSEIIRAILRDWNKTWWSGLFRREVVSLGNRCYKEELQIYCITRDKKNTSKFLIPYFIALLNTNNNIDHFFLRIASHFKYQIVWNGRVSPMPSTVSSMLTLGVA